MRLLAAAMVSRAHVRLAYCAACGWLVLGMAGDLPLVGHPDDGEVEFAHEPVPVPVAAVGVGGVGACAGEVAGEIVGVGR